MRAVIKGLLPLVILLVLGACAPKYEGYGILLWAENDFHYGNGDIIPVIRMFDKTKTVEISIGSETVEFPMWRLRFFRNREEAEISAEDYRAWKWFYAYAEKSGLPVREEADQKSGAIYKLRKNQVVKILMRPVEKSQEGTYENYWYNVLTEDGYSGYCFGELLKVYETEADPFEKAKEYQAQDKTLDVVMSNVWRPEIFYDMIEDGRFDLSKFRTDIGLFPIPAKNSIRIVTDEDSFSYDYEIVKKLGAATYIFENTDLRLEVIGRERLIASYLVEGKQVSRVFVLLHRNINDIIEEELERRLQLYEAFSERLLTSSAYGVIYFDDSMGFTWQGYGKLSPMVLPGGPGGMGKIDFSYYLGSKLQTEYNGIITFIFAVAGGDESRSFLYRLTDRGITLVFIRQEDITELVVPALGVSPLILFFEDEKE